AIEQARADVARRMGVEASTVVFTSGGTESCVLAVWGAYYGALEAGRPITRVLVSAIEHECIGATARALAERVSGVQIEVLPVTGDGVVDLDVLYTRLNSGAGMNLVCVMAANNETGAIQPVAEIRTLTAESGALFVCDAVQAAGRIAIVADYVALSAHKLGGPQGAGALIVREDAPFAAQLLGGGQEKGRRAGTENVAAILGFGAAMRLDTNTEQQRLKDLRDQFERDLKSAFADVVVFGQNAPRLGNTSNFALPGLSAQTAVMALDLDGIAISAGAACSSGKVSRSHVLRAMGVAPQLADAGLRVSFGWTNHDSDGAAAIHSLYRLRQRAGGRAAA
ncbi:MAG: cysteine desulfurase, partial [Alphaproteobacteria bacterium]|nr:cysteine desulfurase [Alphaproteobacteria bacterium]